MAISIGSSYGSILSGNGPSKIYLPVSSGALIYSHFDHVSGVAAGKGQNGVSISRLQILNALIDHLSTVKGAKATPVKNASPEEINSLIENYQTQIRQAVEAAKNSSYGLAGARPDAGVLFSFDA